MTLTFILVFVLFALLVALALVYSSLATLAQGLVGLGHHWLLFLGLHQREFFVGHSQHRCIARALRDDCRHR